MTISGDITNILTPLFIQINIDLPCKPVYLCLSPLAASFHMFRNNSPRCSKLEAICHSDDQRHKLELHQSLSCSTPQRETHHARLLISPVLLSTLGKGPSTTPCFNLTHISIFLLTYSHSKFIQEFLRCFTYMNVIGKKLAVVLHIILPQLNSPPLFQGPQLNGYKETSTISPYPCSCPSLQSHFLRSNTWSRGKTTKKLIVDRIMELFHYLKQNQCECHK